MSRFTIKLEASQTIIVTKVDKSTFEIEIIEKSEEKRPVYHGGCLGCMTDIRYCRGCRYYNGVTSGFPDLSTEIKRKRR